ncbi:MAG: sulfatase [Verrucomicrobia bacterium]|nr:sulfatase [Verrucomicrobiota bacterium]
MTARNLFRVVPALGALFSTCDALAVEAISKAPNVLFIAIDDLNDWIGPLGGHPQVKTPNIDRLARRGIVFTNAHCAAPICNPSRAAVFSGRHPFETGVLANDNQDIRTAQPDLVLLPQHFKRAGYRTYGTGKLLHQKSTGLFDEEHYPEQRWSPFAPPMVEYTAEELPSKASDDPRHVTTLKGRQVILPLNRMPSDRAPQTRGGESFDWGPLEVEDADMGDGHIADWAVRQLHTLPSQPWFLAVGFYRPHIPLFAPKKYFDLYAGMDIRLPEVRADDLDDLSAAGHTWATRPDTAGAHATVVKYGQWEAAVRGYLACVSFVDAQVGKLLDALDAGPGAGNTAIILWGDHGWHLGEKEHWGKWTGWQRATHTPLIIAPAKTDLAEGFKRGVSCVEPVSLLDVYPTLIELCGLPPRAGLSGQSLAPLMRNPAAVTGRHVLTTFDKGNYSVTGKRWHYLHYADGSEELYDAINDPHEWVNLAGKPELRSVQQELAGYLPKTPISGNDPPSPSANRKKKRR